MQVKGQSAFRLNWKVITLLVSLLCVFIEEAKGMLTCQYEVLADTSVDDNYRVADSYGISQSACEQLCTDRLGCSFAVYLDPTCYLYDEKLLTPQSDSGWTYMKKLSCSSDATTQVATTTTSTTAEPTTTTLLPTTTTQPPTTTTAQPPTTTTTVTSTTTTTTTTAPAATTASTSTTSSGHSVLSECQVTANPVDWTVSGSCRVLQAFSSDNIYTCSWIQSTVSQKTFGSFDASRQLCSFTQPMPQDDGLYNYSIYVSPPSTTSFSENITIVPPVISKCSVNTSVADWLVSGSCRVEKANATVYNCSWKLQGGDAFGGFNSINSNVCSFSQSLPQKDGKYTYSISVFPIPENRFSFSENITIASPGNLSIFCPRAVPEGSSFVVACETETAGSPPAIVHLEGEKDKQKVISSVPRTANGTQFRCHMTWGGSTKSTSIYTLLVAYGPETVSIVDSSPSNSTYATLFCSASDAYPGVVYSWKGACVDVNNTKDGSTCLLSQPISDSDVITCTAVNSLFDISATASYGLGTQPPIAAAVGGAAAGVIVLTAISVVAVYLKKRKDGTYARTTGGREEPHPYMDLEIRGEGEGHCDTALPSSS